MKDLIAQRDTEINILVNLLKKERARVSTTGGGPRGKDPDSPPLPNNKLPATQHRQTKNLSKVALKIITLVCNFNIVFIFSKFVLLIFKNFSIC